jgi:hypothetical protein
MIPVRDTPGPAKFRRRNFEILHYYEKRLESRAYYRKLLSNEL